MAIRIERMVDRRLSRKRWLFVVAYVAMIFVLSAQPGLYIPGTFEYKDKIAHAIEYGGLSWLVHAAVRDTWPGTPGGRRALLAVVAISLLGVADEVFQRGVPGRDSSPFDWMADTLGASLAQLLGLAREKRRGGA